MDWDLAIERNGQALRRIVLVLVSMSGLASGSRTHLPRRLRCAVLRLLRPAEAAARRLVIVAARGLDLPVLRPLRPRKPKPRSAFTISGKGTGIVLPRGFRQASPRKPVQRLSLPLFDVLPSPQPRRRSAQSGIPRISAFGASVPHPEPVEGRVRRPPMPDDPIRTARLTLRLEALGRALDDVPREVRRFLRWRARRAEIAADRDRAPGRVRRASPLRPGRPPGLPRKPAHEVHEVLADLQFFAIRALERPDTS